MYPRSHRPAALIILDGWPVPDPSVSDLLSHAHTPNYDELCESFPRTVLSAAGRHAGFSNEPSCGPETGHRTIGAGRAVMTASERVRNAIDGNDFARNPVLTQAFSRAAQTGQPVHFIGLLSDAGRESHQDSLFSLLRTAKKIGVGRAFVHCILDGLDVRPRTADVYVEALEVKMAEIGLGTIASLCGRFYAMDSRENWERTARAFTMLVHGEGERVFDPITAIRSSYLRGISDEFVSPMVIEEKVGEPVAEVREGDLVIFFNHGAEAMRQLVRSLAISDEGVSKPRVETVCLTEYDPGFRLPVAFETEPLCNTLSDVFELSGIANYRITESARADHVGPLLNARRHFVGNFENRIVVPAGPSASLEAEPESKSFKIADRAIQAIKAHRSGAFIVNFPAADLAAEGGSRERTLEAIQYVDTCLGGILEQLRSVGGTAIVTSSHPALRFDERATPETPQNSGELVPLHYFDTSTASGIRLMGQGSLEDIAPTLLGIMGIDKPSEMNGRNLLEN